MQLNNHVCKYFRYNSRSGCSFSAAFIVVAMSLMSLHFPFSYLLSVFVSVITATAQGKASHRTTAAQGKASEQDGGCSMVIADKHFVCAERPSDPA